MRFLFTVIALLFAASSTLAAQTNQQVFAAGQLTLSTNQPIAVTGLTLVYQNDGNFVAYTAGKAVWSSNSFADCSSGCSAAFQGDGNLVLYKDGKAYWSTRTYNNPSAQLVISTQSPYLQIAVNGTSIWPVAGVNVTPAPAPPAPPASDCATLTCYYIDSVAGSDANSGVSQSFAWKSLTNISKVAISPGTSILLKRGSVFSGQQLTLKTSGTASNRILIDAYATGAQPVLSGSTYGILGQKISYISISNISFTNIGNTAVLGAGNGTEYWTVSGCSISNVGTSGIQARPDWNNAAPLRGWIVQGNTVGLVNTLATINYDKAAILMQGTAGALITKNNVAAVNTGGIRIGSYQSAQSQGTTVSYNEATLNQGSISLRDTLNAVVTHNWIHDGKGFGIGIGGSINSQGVYSSYNNVLTYNLIQNMQKSDDGLIYNGIDVNSSANGKMYHNTIENVYAHSITLEGDTGPANNWIVKNNIFDTRRQGPGQDDNPVLFRLVSVPTEIFGNNVYMSNLHWVGIIGTLMDATTDLAIWYTPAWLNLGIDTNSLYNQEVAFINVTGGNLGLRPSSSARNLGTTAAGIGQVSLDAGALPYGQSSVLAF